MSEKETILVVDDTPENIDVLVGLLGKKYKVKAAPSGEKALQSVQKSLPDLILLDIMMPDMDGYETCQHFKKQENTKDIPIIFLTAKTESEDIIKGFEVGAVDYVTKPFNPAELLSRVNTHLQLRRAKKDLEVAHKKITDSIKFASLIQNALLPANEIMKNAFEGHFTIWEPKDIVGGDIILFEKLKEQDAYLLFVIDCTGHGVHGAFLTAFVKAIQEQVIAEMNISNTEVSPSKILSHFNKYIKYLLKQENISSSSNAGFDGGVLFYDKKRNIIRFAGAQTPLFYIMDNNLKSIKGDRQSIGYRNSKLDFIYEEHTIDIDKEVHFYLTTDGFLDQNGGEKGFPLGKRKFEKMLMDNHSQGFELQKNLFLENIREYRADEEKTDDMAMVGFKVRPH